MPRMSLVLICTWKTRPPGTIGGGKRRGTRKPDVLLDLYFWINFSRLSAERALRTIYDNSCYNFYR